MKIKRAVFLDRDGRGVSAPAAAEAAAAREVATRTPRDARVEALVALSCDTSGAPHVERAAFLEAGAVTGTLPVTHAEADALLAALDAADFGAFQRSGLRLAGRSFRFIKDDRDDGATVLHAVRPGEFVTVRAIAATPVTPVRVVIVTSGAGMAHGRAVDALARFARLTRDAHTFA